MAIKFQLDFPAFTPQKRLSLEDGVFFLGSCFAENIYQKFATLGLPAMHNPLGVVYNPISIAEQIELFCKPSKSSLDIVEHEGVYFSWDTAHHLSCSTEAEYRNLYSKQVLSAHNFLNNAKWLVISLGTSWVHSLQETQKVVSNCHKMPSNYFTSRRLQNIEINTSISGIESIIKESYPQINILWTVSPVRYIREGLVSNSRSKAKLLDSMSSIDTEMSSYFPSYEILIDCLRDYRFYAEDMLHPSPLAIDTIFDYLMSEWLLPEHKELLKDLEKISMWNNHRSIHAKKIKSEKILNLENSIRQALPQWKLSVKRPIK